MGHSKIDILCPTHEISNNTLTKYISRWVRDGHLAVGAIHWWDASAGAGWPPLGAFPPRAPRPALGQLGKARGKGGSGLYSDPLPGPCTSRGRGLSVRCALSPSCVGVGRGRTVLSGPNCVALPG